MCRLFHGSSTESSPASQSIFYCPMHLPCGCRIRRSLGESIRRLTGRCSDSQPSTKELCCYGICNLLDHLRLYCGARSRPQREMQGVRLLYVDQMHCRVAWWRACVSQGLLRREGEKTGVLLEETFSVDRQEFCLFLLITLGNGRTVGLPSLSRSWTGWTIARRSLVVQRLSPWSRLVTTRFRFCRQKDSVYLTRGVHT